MEWLELCTACEGRPKRPPCQHCDGHGVVSGPLDPTRPTMAVERRRPDESRRVIILPIYDDWQDPPDPRQAF